ncbi:hypothetical protein [Salininema proteolyticum]|uniref:Uncharacterized protein n=1 Tax=Salininema proteolyticum TaxID=1607685 RepID=A0ABV8U3Q4_9ACTN
MGTCGKCGRTKDSGGCGYCLGREIGAAIQRDRYERERREWSAGNQTRGSGCALVVLAAAALPLAISAALVLAVTTIR